MGAETTTEAAPATEFEYRLRCERALFELENMQGSGIYNYPLLKRLLKGEAHKG